MKPAAAPLGPRSEQLAALVRAFRSCLLGGALILAASVSIPGISLADEGDVSFWIPGFFGSLAAAPQQPGWSVASIFYNTNVSAGSAVALAREFEIRNLPVSLQGQINASVHATGDLGFVIPTYVVCNASVGWPRVGQLWWRHMALLALL
jgi:hypothetical protein